jgi:hypothetical protein
MDDLAVHKEKKTSPVDRRLEQVKAAVDKEKAKKFVVGFKSTL